VSATFARKPIITGISWNTTEGIVKRTALHSATKKNSADSGVRRVKRADRHQVNGPDVKAGAQLAPEDSCVTHDQLALEQPDFKRFKALPKEVGVMLIAAGIVGLIMPGPGTPALIAGGLALWPGAFGKLGAWLEQHHPVVHHRSMKQIGRFLDDLEKRYPYSRQ
jgi:hypothetical protein